MSPRLALVLLLVLVALFCVGIGVGACSGDAKGSDAWLAAVRGLLVRESALPRSDLEAACLSGDTFTVLPAVPCKATIAASKTHVRNLKLRLVVGGEVQVVLEPRGEGASANVKLKAGSGALKLPVFGEGADLTLTFRNGGGQDRCVVRAE